MIITIAVGVGFQRKVKEKISGFNGHVVITNFEDNNSQITVNPVSMNQPFYLKFNDVSGIKNVQTFATKAGIIRTPTDFEGIIYKGVNSDYNWSFFKEYLVAGKLLNITEETTNDVLISNTTAKRLGFKVGDTFNTFFMKEENVNSAPNARVFKIAGIFDTGFEEFDETYVIGDIKQVQRLNKWEPDQVGGFEVLLDNFDQLEQKGREIYSNTPSTLNAQTIAVKYQPVFEWLDLLDVNVIVIIAIMVLVAGINMITALLVLILERTQMIGILKSLGSTNLSIRKIFLYNAGYLIFIGLLWGNLLGIIVLLIQHYTGVVKFPNPENYYLRTIPVYLHWGYIVLLNIGTLLLCLLMLLAPSYIVSRISPVKAIKFE